MKKEVFEAKASEMGDFYVYYINEEDKTKKFAVCTADLSTKYIREQQAKTRSKTNTSSADEVVLWNWTQNRVLVLPYSAITKLVPLSTVLQNGE